jgi:hypothetical protein
LIPTATRHADRDNNLPNEEELSPNINQNRSPSVKIKSQTQRRGASGARSDPRSDGSDDRTGDDEGSAQPVRINSDDDNDWGLC